MSQPRRSRFLVAGLFMALFFLSSAVAFGQRTIVGMSIACSNDRVYTWYSDRTVSVGNSENLSAHQPPHPYSMPFGKTPDDIVEIGIARNDRVYTWYRDSTVSVGTSTDLDKYQPRHPFTISRSKSLASVVGIDIACSNDHVYVWYGVGTASSGTSEDLDKYRAAPYRYFLPSFSFTTPGISYSTSAIVGIGIAGNDHVYAWYRDGTVSSGTSDDLDKYRRPYSYVLGPGPCDISADPPKLNGRVVSSVGIRGPECKSSAEIAVRFMAINPGLPSKILIQKRVSGSNFEVPITYSCTGNRQLTLVTEVETLGRKVKSREVPIANCF